MLLTLSNLQALRVDVVPNLTTQFENAFSVKLTEESKTIRDVLGQIDARLFQSYTRPAVQTIQSIIRNGISASDWAPGPDEQAQRQSAPTSTKRSSASCWSTPKSQPLPLPSPPKSSPTCSSRPRASFSKPSSSANGIRFPRSCRRRWMWSS